MVHVKISGEFYHFQLSLIYLLFASFTLFFNFFPCFYLYISVRYASKNRYASELRCKGRPGFI